MTLLLLIRHGANDWVHGRLAGWIPGIHLNAEGQRQAAALAARLAQVPIDALYASPLDRTVETAQAIAGPRGLPLRLIEAIGEVKYGEWQGAELKELYKHELWPGVQFYPSGTRFPNGETLGETQMRVVAALDSLRSLHHNQTIAVVSHADVIRLAIAYYVGIHIDLFQRLELRPCSLTAIMFTRMGPRLLSYNDTGALDHLVRPPEQAQAADQRAAEPTNDQADHSAEQIPSKEAEQAPTDVIASHNGAERSSSP